MIKGRIKGENMLTLPIQKKWFNMIQNGIKKEEYREIKPYYTTRFINAGLLNPDGTASRKQAFIVLRNGYSSQSPSRLIKCHLKIGTGNKKWGAQENIKYYILVIDKIYDNVTQSLRDFLPDSFTEEDENVLRNKLKGKLKTKI